MSKTKLTLLDYVMSGYPAIICRTPEETRAITECQKVAELTNSKFICWSETQGMFDPTVVRHGRNVSFKYNDREHADVLVQGLNQGEGSPVVFCLLDFHHYLKNPTILRTAKDVFKIAKDRDVTYIFISDSFEVPSDLKHEMVVFDMDLPDQSDFEKLIRVIIEANREECEEISEEDIKKTANALSGLTLNEAENALAISLYKTRRLDLDIIYDIKKQTICQDQLLEYYSSSESMDNVGGMREFKDYAAERSFSAFSQEARDYGLPYPKGVLLFGIPGCGKSLAAKALANMWQVPLVKLDLSKLFASLVGETETNTRRALQMAESMAPCVVWMDEIDKAISGTASSGKTDSGVTARMFGSILTWLQEKEAPVYVIATANNINLPPEFLRKGRFDEIFFVDLPNPEERREIFRIQIKNHNRNPDEFNVDSLVDKSDGYNGAEIEECIVSAMFRAWNDGKRDYTTEDIEEAMEKLTPASKGIMQETVNYLRKWSNDHGIRNANSVFNGSEKTPGRGGSTGRTKRATH